MEAIGHLAGGVAHDFNNQLAGIMMCADLLRSGLTNDQPLFDLADMIVKAAERSSRLTNQLLAFARKGKYQAVPVSMHSVIGEVVSILERSINKKVTIQQILKAQEPYVLGDPSQLHNVLLNIAINANDAMPDGGTLIFQTEDVDIDEGSKIQARFRIDAGTCIRVSVSDTGIGMDEKVRKHIFEPFFTTKEKGKGTGMDLAAAYGALQNHGGGIDVESEPGRGTTMIILLPVVGAAEEKKPPGAYAEPENRTGTILIVDDESLVRDMVYTALERAGFDPRACSNGKDAVDLYRESWQTINLVILDMIMPDMDGREAFLKMKKINPDLKVILSSGYSLDSDTQNLVDAGLAGFIPKPFTIKELIRKISEFL